MKFSMSGQEKGDCLIEVTAWASLTVYIYIYIYMILMVYWCCSVEFKSCGGRKKMCQLKNLIQTL
jgi:hypothetical protein